MGEPVQSSLTGAIEVGLYEDEGGLPGDLPIYAEYGEADLGLQDIAYSLQTPAVLTRGHYWLSPLVFLTNFAPGYWGWWAGQGRSDGPWA